MVADVVLADAGAARWISFQIEERTVESFRQEKRGRPGDNTRYRKITLTHHRVT